MSSCLTGKNVMYNGGNFANDFITSIIDHSETEIVHFCPEDVVLGTPRNNMLIHNGDGNGALEGTSRIIDTEGKDCTDTMIKGANKMLDFALKEQPDLIILTEGSDSWWHRNFRMMAHIQKHVNSGERVLVLGGQGHIAVIRSLLGLDKNAKISDTLSYL
ncbi:MAG: 2-thiouracil desulfurase family protein [Bdellovibrionales bacterium]